MDIPGAFRFLLAATGEYEGVGINHENQKFLAFFRLEPLLEGKAIRIHYKATGLDDTVYHEEISTIAPSEDQSLALYNLNTDTPALLVHKLKEFKPELGAKEGLVFTYNDPEDRQFFREEIHLGFYANGDLSYRYSWGMPKGDFGFRSSVRLKRRI